MREPSGDQHRRRRSRPGLSARGTGGFASQQPPQHQQRRMDEPGLGPTAAPARTIRARRSPARRAAACGWFHDDGRPAAVGPMIQIAFSRTKAAHAPSSDQLRIDGVLADGQQQASRRRRRGADLAASLHLGRRRRAASVGRRARLAGESTATICSMVDQSSPREAGEARHGARRAAAAARARVAGPGEGAAGGRGRAQQQAGPPGRQQRLQRLFEPEAGRASAGRVAEAGLGPASSGADGDRREPGAARDGGGWWSRLAARWLRRRSASSALSTPLASSNRRMTSPTFCQRRRGRPATPAAAAAGRR